MKKLIFVLLFVPVFCRAQTFNAGKQIISVLDFGACIKLIHVDSSVTSLPKTSIGFSLCGKPPGQSVQITAIAGGSNNYTYGFQANAVTPSFGTAYIALDSLRSWRNQIK